MHKVVNNLTPAYLNEMFTNTDTDYTLRNNENKLQLPKPRTDYLKRSFCYDGAAVWNKLPENIRTTSSLSVFRKKLKKHFSAVDSHTAIT